MSTTWARGGGVRRSPLNRIPDDRCFRNEAAPDIHWHGSATFGCQDLADATRLMASDLAGPLAVALDVAREAGDLLRAEFHRPGGPRGRGDHADVDVEIEQLIRARLRSAFPDFGFRGEETGSVGMDRAPDLLWLVDPNDGTRNFLEGSRGSSVSIALLRARQPVLGIVYSPCAPDDDGDLFVWAEGCGPPTRNGRSIRAEPWPDRLEPNSVLLVSEDTYQIPAEILRVAVPARFRPMPSIAYRLALAAGGDGTVGTSFKGAGDWDYAAGHALLRATGADLFDQDGAATSYSPAGESRSRACFGGPASVVAQLVTRPWRQVYTSSEVDLTGAAPEGGPGFAAQGPRSIGAAEGSASVPSFMRRAHLTRGHAIRDPALLRRAHGCLLGQLAGDALGSLVEFQSQTQIRRRYPNGLRNLAAGGTWGTIAGQPTDDSEMAVALARAIVDSPRYDVERAASAYGYWYRSQPFDVGSTTSRALAALSTAHAALSTQHSLAETSERAANAASQSNGSLMRASPLGIWGWALEPDSLAEAARADSRITHPNPVCQEACAAYVVAVSHGVGRGESPRAVYEMAKSWARRSSRSPEVVAAIEAAAHGVPADFVTQSGWVLIALQNAFYQLLHAESAEEGIVATVMAGGDTDTNAAIAGALLGAVYGREALPPQWRNLILSCRPLDGAPGVLRPRPSPFWPVDALELAERLLLSGA